MLNFLKIRPLTPHSDFSQHLNDRHFYMMMGYAFIFHLTVLTIYQWIPKEEVMQIPVRSLNIKLGGGGSGMLANVPNIGVPETQIVKPLERPAGVPETVSENAPAMKALDTIIGEAESFIPEPDREVPRPEAEKRKPETVKRAATPVMGSLNKIGTQVISEDTMRAAQKLPTEYVRGSGAGAGDNFGVANGQAGGVGVGNSEGAQAEVLRRYEQIISLWIQRHKIYPAEAKNQNMQGQAIIRIRINREGTIVFSRLDKATRYPMLNEAIAEMIRASNPVPAVPSNYPAGNLFEFLIPVSFRLE